LHLLREIFNRFEGRDDFRWEDVLHLIEREPELALINASVRHKIGTEVDGRMNSAASSSTADKN
jgi:hypothetical protein